MKPQLHSNGTASRTLNPHVFGLFPATFPCVLQRFTLIMQHVPGFSKRS